MPQCQTQLNWPLVDELTMILTDGFIVLSATAHPARSPPPPVGMTTASTSGTCSRISSPVVPCPAMMLGWSKLKGMEPVIKERSILKKTFPWFETLKAFNFHERLGMLSVC